MQKKIVAATMTALFAVLAFVSIVVTDFHDRTWPHQVGVESEVTLDFSDASVLPWDATAFLSAWGEKYELGLLKLVPDLDDPGQEVLVALNGQMEDSVSRFGVQSATEVLAPDRLLHSASDGTYYVQDSRRLDEALERLEEREIGVMRQDASVTVILLQLASEAGFLAPLLSTMLLVASLSIFWLASRARSRGLRVLAGSAPWRIQTQDTGGYLVLLLSCAALVAVVGSLLVGALGGAAHVSVFATSLVVLEGVTLLICAVVVLLLSWLAWPSADLFTSRAPAVAMLRRPARIMQAVTLLALLTCTGPAWTAAQNSEQTAGQLAAWTTLSDQVSLSFAVEERHFDRIAPRVAQVVSSAEADGRAALSYTITESDWEGDFGDYSAISIVTPGWVDLVAKSVGSDALVSVPSKNVDEMLHRELGSSFELWNDGTRSTAESLSGLAMYQPATGTTYPVSDRGSGEHLLFLDDVLVLVAPTVSDLFDDPNLISLASTGHITLTGVSTTRELLDTAGLNDEGLGAMIRTCGWSSAGRREGAHLPEDDLTSKTVLIRTGVDALVREGTPMLNVAHNAQQFTAEDGGSLLDEIVREGARQMLAAALQAEVAAYIEAHDHEVDEHGHRLVVRNGYHEQRQVTTAAGAIAVRQPRVNDKRTDETTGQRKRFSSAILPAWARKSPQMAEVLPLLYLHGLSSSDFTPALEQFLGTGAGLSATTITRLTAQWQDEARAFNERSLAATDYVYVWVDGIHLKVRLEQDKICLLVMIGVRADGTKELIALAGGFRESSESWADLLRDAKRRGMGAPVLAIGDGALGFWTALRDVFPTTREQRCWFHKTGNVLAALPKSAHPGAKKALGEITGAEDRDHALAAARAFERDYGTKWPKAAAKITDELDVLLEFYNYPAEHWIHLRTTNPIESTFATVRLRQRVTKGPGSRAAGVAMAFKLMEAAQARWRAVNAPHLVALVRAGATFDNGKLVERPDDHTPETPQEEAA